MKEGLLYRKVTLSLLIQPSHKLTFQGHPPHSFCEGLTLLSSPIQWHFYMQTSPILLLVRTYLLSSYFLLLHLGPLPGTMHFTLKMEATRSLKMVVSYHNTTLHHNPEDHDLNEFNLISPVFFLII